MIKVYLRDIIIGITFTVLLFIAHYAIDSALSAQHQLKNWYITYLPQIIIYFLLFFALRKMVKIDPTKIGFVFLGAATLRLLTVSLSLIVFKKLTSVDIAPLSLHISCISLIFIIFETVRTFRLLAAVNKK